VVTYGWKVRAANAQTVDRTKVQVSSADLGWDTVERSPAHLLNSKQGDRNQEEAERTNSQSPDEVNPKSIEPNSSESKAVTPNRAETSSPFANDLKQKSQAPHLSDEQSSNISTIPPTSLPINLNPTDKSVGLLDTQDGLHSTKLEGFSRLNLAQTPQQDQQDRQLPTFPRPLPQPLPPADGIIRDTPAPPSQQPQNPPPAPLPPPEQLLESQPSPRSPEPVEGKVPASIRVERFEFVGNTAISSAELREATKEFVGREISFAELFQARSKVTELYVKKGFITSGALIPPQTLESGVVRIQVVEGTLESINVTGTRRLNPGYVRSRIGLATFKPLNRDRLLEALQLLQLNPLIQSISAELAAGTQPGSSVLEVRVTEAKTFNAQILLDNNRAPSVGSFQRRLQISQANLSGAGDNLVLGYSNTDGSNGLDLSYTLPLNPRNGTLRFSYGTTSSNVIEPPFDRLDINASSRYYELTYRQPIFQTPTREFALGLTASRQESETSVLEIPFPLSLGADDQGRTRITALRFFQEWTQRSSREVIAARSQFSLGLNQLGSTINASPPDSRFFSWRGQAQWVRLLGEDTLFLVRGDVQLADRALVPLEQFGLGGQQSVRGYRQDILLTDNGALISAEVRVPVLRIPKWNTLVQLAPFFDIGGAWNQEGRPDPDPSLLASLGLGLQLQVSDRLSVRLDYGIPLVSVPGNKRTWQEHGFYFSIVATPFTF
jgi:hemolysin activation/secretion protein